MSNVSQSVFTSNLPTSLIYLIPSLIHFNHHKNILTFFLEKILSWTTSLYIYEGSKPSRKTSQETTLSPLASIILYHTLFSPFSKYFSSCFKHSWGCLNILYFWHLLVPSFNCFDISRNVKEVIKQERK